MSYLIWNLNDSALRRACIESAFFSCGWHSDDTLGEIKEQMCNEGGTPEDTETFEKFVQCLEQVDCGIHLRTEANWTLNAVYKDAKPEGMKIDPITVEEILMTMFDPEEWFDELAD